MFRIKICGVRSLQDACMAAEAGGDAVGFNFHPPSVRYVPPEVAAAIASQLPVSVVKVGVFVDETADSIAKVCRLAALDCVQLHGDEPATMLAELPRSVLVVRAFRLPDSDFTATREYLEDCRGVGRLPDAVIVDAHVPGSYGGTGRTVDWPALAEHTSLVEGLPLILAGGLTPDNVAAAIRVVRPFGVDTASGVELSPGVKSRDRVYQFISAARHALGNAGN